MNRVIEDSESEIARGAHLALSGLAGLLLAFILTFFAVKDGPSFGTGSCGGRPTAGGRRCGRRRSGWAALGGYLRGSACSGWSRPS